jgi:hypothetical protein
VDHPQKDVKLFLVLYLVLLAWREGDFLHINCLLILIMNFYISLTFFIAFMLFYFRAFNKKKIITGTYGLWFPFVLWKSYLLYPYCHWIRLVLRPGDACIYLCRKQARSSNFIQN